jgi:phosphoribosylformylglycinamidine synthase
MLAVAEAARNVACAGARPLGATNCLNFGNPEKPPVMGQFREVIEGMAEACEALEIPITGGNVSFYNETDGQAIYPTPVVGVVGVLDSIEHRCAPPFRNGGRSIVLLGRRSVSPEEFAVTFGSSQYAQTILGALWGLPPAIDLDWEKRVQACCRRLIAEGLAESAHDVSDGGLAVALAECCLGPNIGAAVELPAGADRRAWLFAEEPSRIVLSVAASGIADAKRIAGEYNVAAESIGTTGGTTFQVIEGGQVLFELPVSSLRVPYERGLERAVEADGKAFSG